jgi:GTP cyclohydrolase I
MSKVFLGQLSWGDVDDLAEIAAGNIWSLFCKLNSPRKLITAFAVPRGGVYAALLIQKHYDALTMGHDGSRRDDIPKLRLTDEPMKADLFIDDLIDTGDTMNRMRAYRGQVPFVALYDKRTAVDPKAWLTFPWEVTNGVDESVEANVTRIIQQIGDDPNRDGLRETPKRVCQSYKEIFSGYAVGEGDLKLLFKTFESGTDEMVLLKDLELYSTCEHHMLPFYGKAHIAYIPRNGRVIGVSKLARVLEVFSRRLQIQERIGSDVVNALMTNLEPLGAACVIEARHFCMQCRGVNKQHSKMITSNLAGVFKDKPEVRAEFFSLIKG